MAKLLAFLLSITLFSCANNDQHNPKEIVENTKPAIETPKTLMWRIQYDTIILPSYLFGTYHEMGNSILDSFVNVKQHLHESKTCLIETLIHESNEDIDKLFKFDKAKTINIVNIWKGILSMKEYEILVNSLLKIKKSHLICLPAQEVYAQLSYYIYENYCNPYYAKSDSIAMDNYIENIAKSEKKKLIGLDDKINYKHVKHLYDNDLNYLKNQDQSDIKEMMLLMNQIINDTVNCSDSQKYLNFNIEYSFDKYVDYETYGLNLRNEKWLPIIEKSIKEGSSFIAVGYQHLCYSNGLIQRLKSKGYTVTPIAMNSLNSNLNFR